MALAASRAKVDSSVFIRGQNALLFFFRGKLKSLLKNTKSIMATDKHR
jgi:hypothetical protein